MEFRLHHATEHELPIILALIKELAEYETLSHAVVATEEILRKSIFERRAAEVVIGYAGDAPAGLALFFPNYSTFLGKPGIYLEDLFVLPEWRGHGFGRELLAHLATLAVERGCGRLEWVVLNWNEPAIRFYEKLGAKSMDEWTTFRVTGDALHALARRA